jgi:hypothetical protein
LWGEYVQLRFLAKGFNFKYELKIRNEIDAVCEREKERERDVLK